MTNPEISKAIKRDRVMIILFPLLLSVVLYFIINSICIEHKYIIDESEGIDNLKTILGVWSTLLGFLITAISILLALGNGKFLDMLKKTGHYKTILLSYVVCCVHLLIAIIFAMVCILCRIWSTYFFSIMCVMVIDTLLMVALCLFFLFTLVVRIND